jgi:hypothetical protein
MASGRVVEVSREELELRRKEVLDRLGISLQELAGKARAGSLVGDEWEAWQDLQDVGFLLGDSGE